MGFNFRKSIKIGPARINLSKSGVGYSVGAGGLRYTKSAKRKKADEKKGCFGSLCSLVLVCGLIGLAIEYIEVIVFILILIAVAAVIFFGVRVYKAKKSVPQIEAAEPTDDNIVDSQ